MKPNEGTLNGVATMQLMRGEVLKDGPYRLKYGVDGRDVFLLEREEDGHELAYDFSRVVQAGDDSWTLEKGSGKKGGKLFLNNLDEYNLLREALRTIAKAFDKR